LKTCTVCKKTYDPKTPITDPAEEAGLFMAREVYGDAEDLCLPCLANRGRLAMMYCTEYS
jgi:hypothetical protein